MKNITIHKLPLWLIPLVLSVAVLVLLTYTIYVPMTMLILKEVSSLIRNQSLARNAGTFPDKLKKINNEIDLLDSCVTTIKQQCKSDKANIVESLYSFTDSAGLKATKVEIGDPLLVDNHKEIPITIKGSGTYESIGKFTECIENAHEPVKIRQLIIKESDEKLLAVSIEFVIIEQKL